MAPTRFSNRADRLLVASNNLLKSLQLDDLQGISFLDIGCGSGLHSLAAWRAGAKKVVSFDYDKKSVESTKILRDMCNRPNNWTIMQGSVLDDEFMANFEPFDIVYSWGVLHHTGDMWKAISNAAKPLAKNGIFFTALYSDTSYRDASLFGAPTPEKWLAIKQKYNIASSLKKKAYEIGHLWDRYFVQAFPNPLAFAKAAMDFLCMLHHYKKERGMEFWTDLRDWLGGWPMDFVRERDYIKFCMDRLQLEPLRINSGEGNTEFIFRPEKSSNYWDAILEKRKLNQIDSTNIEYLDGHTFFVALPDLAHCSDQYDNLKNSNLTLFENGIPLGYRHANLEGIKQFGEGRYLHWADKLFFASSDNTSPSSNGKLYTWCIES